MRALLTSLTMVVFMFISTSQADYSINRFVVSQAGGDQTQSDIDGDWIVWVDERAGSSSPHIYGYTLAEPNEVAICTDTSTSSFLKKHPAVRSFRHRVLAGFLRGFCLQANGMPSRMCRECVWDIAQSFAVRTCARV